MSRYRALALRASLAAAIAAALGAATLTPGTASAAPDNSAAVSQTAADAKKYPPAPPKLTVNHGRVKPGAYVRATGKKYRSREKVTIVVRFKPKGSSTYRTVGQRDIRADRNGKFVLSLRLAKAGTVSIKGRGHTSHQSSTATVIVTKGKNRGAWVIKFASFDAATPAQPAAVAAGAASKNESSPAGGLAVAGLGAAALIGSAATFQVVRRRRRAGAAA